MSAEVTPAVRRAAEWLLVTEHGEHADLYQPDHGQARAVVAAALDGEEVARAVADNLYGQDVHTLVMRRPGETHRDQAERIGRWAAETVRAAVVGAA